MKRRCSLRRYVLGLVWLVGLACGSVAASSHAAETAAGDAAARWQIVRTEDGWRLLRGGEPFYIQGAVGWNRFDVLRARGGNAVRATARRESLDAAHAEGLAVMANLPVRGERDRIDWGNAEQFEQQKGRVLAVVRELQDHPAVMFWAVGNELDYTPGKQGYHPLLWKRLNELAIAIKEIDDRHPVMTVVGSGDTEEKFQRMAAACPDMDLLGINTYGDIGKVTADARRHWRKPYVLAEWGPTGHWQVPKTEWRAPLEQTSSEKAQVIRQRYEESILSDKTHCLGSFVFYWSEKQETTHTWYGLFRDGLGTESIDVMQYLWTGKWPENRAPTIERVGIEGFSDPRAVYLAPGETYRAVVQAADADGDALEFAWDVRPEVEIPAGSYAGSLEKKADPIEGLVKSPPGATVEFTAPAQSGAYRIFVTILDDQDHAAYGNVPFYVRKE